MSEGRTFAGKKSIKNWPEYNAGLVRRYDITVHLVDEAVVTRPEPTGKRGRPVDITVHLVDEAVVTRPEPTGKRGRPVEYTDGFIELGLTLKAMYRLPYRGLEGFMLGLFKLSDCADRPVPDYTTFCVRAPELEIAIRAAVASGKPLHLLVDSTGVKIYGEGEWKMRTHGKSKKRTWRKLHLIIDEATQQIIVADLTKNDVGDQEHLPALLKKLPETTSVKEITGDGIYDTWGCYDAAAEYGADFTSPPRSNAVAPDRDTLRGLHPRSQAIRECETLGRTPWKIEVGYHRRSLVETAMYRYKTSFGEKMFSREFTRQKTEALIKANTLNTFRSLAAPAY